MKVADLSGALLDYWVARSEIDHDIGQLKGCAIRKLDGDRAVITDPSGNDALIAIVCSGFFAFRKTRAELQADQHVFHYSPSTRWNEGGGIIENDLIYVQPPRDVHYNGGPNAGWKRYDEWTATVSARTRTLPPQNELSKMIGHGGVGRGAGETPLIAAMRAKVASHYGDEVPDETTSPA